METIETHTSEETREFARQMGRKVQPGTVIALVGDLGAGKTVFAKGFAEGLGITSPVSSPTFTIVRGYEEGRLPLYHFDVYRIGDISEMDEIGYEDCFYGEGVSLVEWADAVDEIMPPDTVWVTIEKDPAKGFDYRKVTVRDEHSGH